MSFAPRFALPLSAVVPVLSAFAQESALLFDAPQDQIWATRNPIRALVDFNGDGVLDAFALGAGNGGVTVEVNTYANSGNGFFQQFAGGFDSVNLGSAVDHWDGFARVELGDLDGDGDQDALWSSGGVLARALIAADGELEAEILDDSGALIRALVAADLGGVEGDEALYLTAGELRVRAASPAGQVGALLASLSVPEPEGNAMLRVIDLDGDANPDLLLCDTSAQLVRSYTGTGSVDAPFVVGPTFPHGIEQSMFDVGDVDGDGDTDAVIFGMAGEYRVLRATPSGLKLEAPQVGGPAEFLRDVDGDGDLDGVCCSSGGSSPPGPNGLESIFEIAIADGTGGFAPSFTIPGLGAQQMAGVDDVDGDGDLDLVAGRCVYFARGDIKQSNWAVLGERSGPLPRSAGERFDADLDGDVDLFPGLESAELGLGRGQFVWGALAHAAAPAGTEFVGPGYPGDFDGDGDTDFLVEHRATGGSLIGMRLLLSEGGYLTDGGASGDPGISFSLGSLDARDCLALDLDDDGDLDLATTAPYAGGAPFATALWRNEGGTFSAGPAYVDEHLLGAGDFDGDGRTDLLMMLDQDGTQEHQILRIRLAEPGGFGAPLVLSFADMTFYGREGSPVALGSLTSFDNFVDIVIDTAEGSTFLYWNDGGPVGSVGFPIGTVPILGPGPDPTRVHVVDIDLDGVLDVMGGPPEYSPQVTRFLLRDTPDSPPLEWKPAWNQVTGDVVPVDVDGDGDLDLVGRWVVENVLRDDPEYGSKWQYGVSAAGSGGVAPILGAHGPASVGSDMVKVLVGAVGGSPAALAIGFGPAETPGFPFPGLVTHLALAPTPVVIPLVTSGLPGEVGTGGFEIPYSVGPGMVGQTFWHQAFVFDAGAASFFSASNGLEITYGQ